MSAHHHHAVWVRAVAILLVFSLLIGSMPPATAAPSVGSTPSEAPSPVPPTPPTPPRPPADFVPAPVQEARAPTPDTPPIRQGSPPPAETASLQAITPSVSAAALASAMDIPSADLISATLMGSDPRGVGIGDQPLSTDFPRNGNTFAIMSTGLAASADDPNTNRPGSTELTGDLNSTGGDLVQLALSLQVPDNRTCLEIDYAFYTEEYPEFVGQSYNDTFTIELGGTDLRISGTNVLAPLNFAFDPEGNIISVNTVFQLQPSTGTTYNGGTPLLRAQTPVTPTTAIEVVFSIQDLGDQVFDSAVLIDNVVWSTDPDCGEGSDLVTFLDDAQNRRSEDLCASTQPTRGGPINTRTGNLWTETTDLAVTSPGPPLVWTRIYHSQGTDDPPVGLGPGWQHPYAARLITATMPSGEPDTVIVITPKGNWLRYADQGNGQFEPGAGVYHTLVPGDGIYTQILRDQTQQIFDTTTGRLLQVVDPQGRVLDLTYDGSSRLTQITDARDTTRQLTLGYTGSAPQIARISDGTRTVQYTYDANGDLTEVHDVMNRPTTYTYQNHLLTQITNALGQPIEITEYEQPYTAESKAIRQTLQDGQHLAFTYLQSSTVITTTGVDGQRDHEELFYASDHTMARTVKNGRMVTSARHTSDFCPGILADGNGNTKQAQFDAAGLPTQITNALGETTQTTYNDRNHPTIITDTLGRRTERSYDDDNNLIQHTTDITDSFPGFTTRYTYTNTFLSAQQGPDGVVTQYERNDLGQILTQIVGAGTAEALRTTYTYDQLGRVTAVTTGAGTPLARTAVTEYNADNTIARRIDHYVDGIFDPAIPDADLITTYGYDQLGRQVWVQDVLGHVDVTHYDAQGRVDWTARNLVPFQTDTTGLPVFQSFDPDQPDQNVATRYGYDGLGRTVLVTQTGVLTGAFDPQTQTFADATTRVTHTAYDALSRPIRVTQNYQPDQPVNTLPDVNVQTATQYDTAGNVVSHRDAFGRWTVTNYDALNRPITVTQNFENGDPLTVDADNQSWATITDTDTIQVTAYRPDGQIDSTIDHYVDGVFDPADPVHDRKQVYVYDDLGRMTAVIHQYVDGDPATGDTATDRRTMTAYDRAGRVMATQDPLDRWTVTDYDVLGRVARTIAHCTNASGTPQTGNCSSDHGPANDRNIATTLTYDALWRASHTTDALEYRTRTVYDGVGRTVTTIQNEQDGVYDPANPAEDVITQYIYDALGRVVATTDPTGATTTVAYDGLGRTRQTTDATNRTSQMGYDGPGTMRWSTTPDDRTTVIQLDGLGRPSTTIANYQNGVVGSDEPTDQDLITQTIYDLAGRRSATVDPAGRRTAFVYDLQDRLIAVTENVTADCADTATDCNITTRYAYDRVGNRTTIVDANGHTRRFAYDAADQQITAYDGFDQSTGWQYDRGGRRVRQDDPRGVDNDLSWTYDDQDRLTGIDATNLDAIGMAYDPLGRRTRLTDGTGTTGFAYDPLGRMTQVTAPGTGTVGYSYTARGERSQLTYPDGTVVDYTYQPDGLLDTVTSGGRMLADYTYDPVGRVAQTTLGNGAVTSYAYDEADRLRDLHTTVAGNTVSRFQYEVDRRGLRTHATETFRNDASAAIPTTGLGLWLRADTGVMQDGNQVTSWADQSGQGRDATASSAASQPTLVDNALNGQPALRFDGTDDGLTFDYPINGLTGMTMIMVSANASDTPTSTSGQRAALFWNETNSWGATFLSPYQQDAQVRFGTTQPSNNLIYDRPTAVNTTYSRTSAVHNGTTDTLYVNGSAVLTETGKLSTISGTRDTGNLGRGYNDDSFFHGDIVEVLVYSRALDAAELQQVDQYLERKYFGGASAIPQEGLGLWLRADAGVTQDGNQVTSWADQSGQGRTATVASAANQPTLVPNALNGQPALRFDGNDDFLTFDYPITDLRSMTMVAVSANASDTPTSPSGREAILFWNETSNWGATFLSAYQGAAQARFGTTQTNNNLISTRPSSVGTDYTRTAAVHRGTTDVVYVDGTAVLTETGKWSRMRATTPTGNLGRGHDDNTFFHGDIVEVLVYSRALDETELQQVDQYLATKYFGATSGTMTTVAAAATDAPPAADTPDAPPPPATAFGTPPLAFVPNRGQHHDNVHFAAQGPAGTVWFTADEAVLAVPTNPTEPDHAPTEQRSAAPPMQWQSAPLAAGPPALARLQLIDANANPTVRGTDRLPSVVHDLRGQDATQWQRNLPTYGGIVYEAVYPGIDLHYTSQEGHLKRTYIVAPGSDPTAIHWRYDGAETVTVDAEGHLQVTLAADPADSPSNTPPVLTEQAPIAWQIIANEYVLVPVQYAVAGDGTARFTIADYDPTVPLMIDPVLVYSTYLGGYLTDWGGNIITADDGSVYVVGSTTSSDFPTTPPTTTIEGSWDVFVAQLNATGTSLLFAAYLGGDDQDSGYDLAQLPNGNLAITGTTYSTDFPTTAQTFQSNHAGVTGDNDAFAAVLDPGTGELVYSTYLGGSHWDFGYAVDVDSAGHLYVVGETVSQNFPTTSNAFEDRLPGTFAAFVAQIDPTATWDDALVYSTYLGGAGQDGAVAVAVRPDDSLVVSGYSGSNDFPVTATAYQTTHAGSGDVFLTWLDPTATGDAQLRYSTYLGGEEYEIAHDLALDSQGRVALVGTTRSDTFPVTPDAYQSTPGERPCPSNFCQDAFVVSLDPTATGAASLVHSTYLGGTSYDEGYGVTVTNQDVIVVTGMTASADFPVTADAFEGQYYDDSCTDPADPLGNPYRCPDAFVTRFHPDFDIAWSTYLGSYGDDRGASITHDADDNLYLVGRTTSADFPRENPIQRHQGDWDAFITKIGAPPAPPTARTITYTYDELSRLVRAVEDPGTSYRYDYDRVGNRIDNGRTYNQANEVRDFRYDQAGNLRSDAAQSYSYDALGRLTRQRFLYTYNGDGLLVGSIDRSYTQDVAAPLSQILHDGQANYTYGLERINSSDGAWYVHDGLGSVRLTLDAGGAPSDILTYDPWGLPIAGTPDPFGFTGEFHDRDLVHLRARWYNPNLGTFTSRDPFAGFDQWPYSLHPYQYAYSNPVLLTDPSGKHPTNPTDAELVFVAARIQKLYTDENPDFHKAEYPVQVKDEYGSRTRYIDLVNLATGAIYEIKYATADSEQAREQIQDYIKGMKAKRNTRYPTDPDAEWHAGRTFLKSRKFFGRKYDLGPWPVGLDPSYVPTHKGEVYVIKAWLDPYNQGIIRYIGEKVDDDRREKKYDYDWREIDQYIDKIFPEWRNNHKDYTEGKKQGIPQNLPPDLPAPLLPIRPCPAF